VAASVVFEDYNTPDGLVAYKEYLGRGTGTQGLYEGRARTFYHKPDKDYTLKGVSLFIATWDSGTGETFEPDIATLALDFPAGGNSYKANEIFFAVDDPQWPDTWQVTFFVDEELKKDEWHEMVARCDIPEDNRYKLWIAHTKYEFTGLRGEEQSPGSGRYWKGPISVFFESGETAKPFYRPIVLIHGLGESPEDYSLGNNKGVYREKIMQMYQDDPSGFEYPESWIHNYSYGLDRAGNYDYQGSIIDISKNLDSVLEELSQDSSFHGGDGLVDIIGYSLGGLVPREHLRNNPQEGRLGKIITIAAPHQGANIVKFKEDIQFYLGLFSLALDEILTETLKDFCKPGQVLDTESEAVQQIWPGSWYMKWLNSDPVSPPNGIDTIATNIHAFISQDIFIFDLNMAGYPLGDLVVLPENALDVPKIDETQHPFEDRVELGIGAIELEVEKFKIAKAIKQSLDTDPLWRYWHLRMVTEPEIVDCVMKILKGET
jgi:pimeloyl-ACP methyl ester carboxylesterase